MGIVNIVDAATHTKYSVRGSGGIGGLCTCHRSLSIVRRRGRSAICRRDGYFNALDGGCSWYVVVVCCPWSLMVVCAGLSICFSFRIF